MLGAADRREDPAARSFYVAGGWSEWAPFPCGHTDAARLQRSPAGEWKWTLLPDLPHPVVFGGATTGHGALSFYWRPLLCPIETPAKVEECLCVCTVQHIDRVADVVRHDRG